jgi:hypothetical protein
MCEKAVTSSEHVPPKCLFPEKKDLPKGFNFRKSLIRVPSCDEHNSHKSLDDEYLMFILASAFQGNDHKQRHFKTKIMRAVDRKPHVFISFLDELYPVYLEGPNGTVEESACFKVNLERFDRAVQHMACGIFYHHYKRKWRGGFKVFTNILMDMSSRNAPEVNALIQEVSQKIDQTFSGLVSLGENDEIFKYKIFSDIKDRHAVHMTFYEGVQVTVLLNNV